MPGLKLRATQDIAGVQWGKLLVNLNNALNALAGLPLRRQLAQRTWRRLFADQMAEGLAALRAEGIEPVSSTPVPASWTPHLLRLPDAIFNVVLGRTMKIDPEARSSMWEDLQRGRATEIDYLQGVIIEIADRHGLQVPLSRRIVALIRERRGSRQGFAGTDAGADPRCAAGLRSWIKGADNFSTRRPRASIPCGSTYLLRGCLGSVWRISESGIHVISIEPLRLCIGVSMLNRFTPHWSVRDCRLLGALLAFLSPSGCLPAPLSKRRRREVRSTLSRNAMVTPSA